MDRLDDAEIEDLSEKLGYVSERCTAGSYADFIESLERQLEEKGWLSPKQIECVDRAYARQKEWDGQ